MNAMTCRINVNFHFLLQYLIIKCLMIYKKDLKYLHRITIRYATIASPDQNKQSFTCVRLQWYGQELNYFNFCNVLYVSTSLDLACKCIYKSLDLA